MIEFKQKLTIALGFNLFKSDMCPVSFCKIGFNINELRGNRTGSPKKPMEGAVTSPHTEHLKGLKVQVVWAHAFI